jgi:Rad3-related DNA helicase
MKSHKELCDPRNMAGGQIILSICRGKISEGYDFPDEMARAVIIIGIPYASIKEKKLVLRQEYYIPEDKRF